MTSRERLLAALNHQQPDRVPIDFGATQTSGLNVCALNRLRKYYGLEEKPLHIYETIQMLGTVDEDIRKIMGSDVIGLNCMYDSVGCRIDDKNGKYKTFVMNDGTEALLSAEHNWKIESNGRTYMYPQGDETVAPSMMMPDGGYFFDLTNRSPGWDEDDLTPEEDFKEDFASVMSDEEARYYEEQSKQLYNDTEYGIIGIFGRGGIGDAAAVPGAGLKSTPGIRSFEDWCMALMICPEYVETVYGMWTENCIKNLEIYHQAVGDNIQAIVMSGTDFGTQNAPFFSTDMFRELYVPYYKKMNDWVHEHTNWKTYFHTCGAIVPLLDDIVDMGVDIINPVQLSATGMDARMLKDKYGDKLVFWGGGVDTQSTLPNGTPEEIRQEVQNRLDILAPGGGYVFNTIHNIQGNVSAENIDATFRAAREWSYPNK